MMTSILIVAQTTGDQPTPALLEAVGAAQSLAGSSADALATLVIGPNARAVALGLGGIVGRVLAAEEPQPAASLDWLIAAAQRAADLVQPRVVLLPHAGANRELAATLAFRNDGGLVTDATALRLEGETLVATKPVFGGSAIAEQAIVSPLAVATLRPRAFPAAELAGAGSGEVETIDVPAADGRVQVLEEVREQATAGPRLKDAKVVVSGGRGLGGPDNWQHVEELAQVLGGAVGASRAVTDAGWVPPALQVGLTGSTVAPDLYVAIGISGAVQHIAGITGARTVVAINKDPDANIFKYARFGVVGDWKQVLPAFTQRLRELRG